jgi:hypothetical protein
VFAEMTGSNAFSAQGSGGREMGVAMFETPRCS